MKRWLSVALAFLLIGAAPAWAVEKPDILEVLSITGELRDGLADRLREQIEKLNDNKRVKAVLLEVDSPGGGVLATDAAYEELGKLKVPVVAWCNNECASGGYYVLMTPSVKFIAMREVTITGSVGVLAEITRFHRLLEWAKIDPETYTSGNLKDAGNPTKIRTEVERAYIQSIIDHLATRFYTLVQGKMALKPEALESVKTGRIFFGEEAVKLGLAHGILSRDAALKKAKELSGSKEIFTREELKKMATEAQGESGSRYQAPLAQPFGDVPWLIEALKEIRHGESIRFEYRMPYKF